MDRVYKVDLVLVIVSVVVLIGLVGYARPLVIAPLNDYESSGEVLFLIEKADYLFVDDNVDFTTPVRYEVRDGMKVDLVPGVYYWRAVGVLGSEVRTLTINSVVSLELRETEGGFGVVNAGNVGLNVDVYDGLDLVGKRKLGVGEFARLEPSALETTKSSLEELGAPLDGGDKFIGGQE